MRASLYCRCGKRLLDALAAAVGLLILSPVLLLISVAIKLSDPGPVFFRQTRVGRGFKPFQIVKFRSMRRGAAGPNVTRAGDPRVTAIGRVLRKTKLDELPQLFNVLRGDMSLVGPRPEVPQYVERFHADYEEVLAVRPGITDMAAIEFCDEESLLEGFDDAEKGYVDSVLPRKLALYRRYIAGIGLLSDLRIVLATLRRLAA